MWPNAWSVWLLRSDLESIFAPVGRIQIQNKTRKKSIHAMHTCRDMLSCTGRTVKSHATGCQQQSYPRTFIHMYTKLRYWMRCIRLAKNPSGDWSMRWFQTLLTSSEDDSDNGNGANKISPKLRPQLCSFVLVSCSIIFLRGTIGSCW